MKNYICNNTEYFFGNGYIAVSVEINGLPNTIEVNGKTLLIKSEFWVSLVCVKDIVAKYGENYEQKVIDFFCDFVQSNKISFSGCRDEFRYATDKETDRETIIVMSDISNIKEFFDALNKEFGFDIETPPTHITLYALQQDKGIGLNDSLAIKEKTKIITNQIPVEIKKITSLK